MIARQRLHMHMCNKFSSVRHSFDGGLEVHLPIHTNA